MKTSRDKKKFLAELEEVPWIHVAAKRANIHPATIYRWRKLDLKFAEAIERSQIIGIEHRCGVTDSKLASLIQKEHFGAIKFFLEHNDPRYASRSNVADRETNLLEQQTEILKQLIEKISDEESPGSQESAASG